MAQCFAQLPLSEAAFQQIFQRTPIMKTCLQLLTIIFSVLALTSCGESTSVKVTVGPSFQEAWLSSDAEGNNRVTSYGANDTVHAKADLVGAEAGTKVEAKMIAVKVDHPDVSPETEVGSFEQTFDGELNRMNFDFSNDGAMPSGSYRIDLRIDGADATSLPFTIPAG